MEKESSNYIQITIYDKQKETEYRLFKKKATLDETVKYRNVIRTELKLKNGKLNSEKHNKQIDKDLHTYYNSEKIQELYHENVSKIFGNNDFYRIDEALDIIAKSNKVTNKMKSKLSKLLKLINKHGYSKAKEMWLKKYSYVTFKTHIRQIECLGINILTFDKVIDNHTIEQKSIKNFTGRENGIQE